MQLHHYEHFYKFYLYSEDRNDLDEEKANKGLEIPFGSTTKNPPLNKCKKGEIPVFINGEWEIVVDDFWRPCIEEINYDAGRKVDTFQFIEPNMIDFMKFPTMPQLCNTALVGMRIQQSLIIINKKFAQCIDMYNLIRQGGGNKVLYSPNQGTMIFNPSIMYEFKMELESIVFIMRRILDSLVQLTDLLVNFSLFEKNKKLNYESIGSILSKEKNSEIRDILVGNDIYEKDTTNFLNISNDLFNGFKHTLMQDELFSNIGIDYPTILGFHVKYANHKKIIQYHNHNAYHFMMGFQDCIARILRNIDTYKLTKNSNS
ncbi:MULTISPECIES: hypothetical protein [Aliarcobacter]|uniref:hypothetical protein n=1 Tax=Aliarcobacter TaxID=2321111 RepID=UPI001260C49B|nr:MULTISPECIES: hypothetical protein [Aliarcobacter]MCT7587062.1 hypothetical protein [Aliarcobacter butzleri]MCT7625434.1 hypothetical protein [Aliarcobacter butzleri]MCT7642478.1 hypothetical protein [Aliarcobacter butzleri]QNM93174.1 hypothetical protein HOO33_04920 [Aliarcobacter cryaerophilus]